MDCCDGRGREEGQASRRLAGCVIVLNSRTIEVRAVLYDRGAFRTIEVRSAPLFCVAVTRYTILPHPTALLLFFYCCSLLEGMEVLCLYGLQIAVTRYTILPHPTAGLLFFYCFSLLEGMEVLCLYGLQIAVTRDSVQAQSAARLLFSYCFSLLETMTVLIVRTRRSSTEACNYVITELNEARFAVRRGIVLPSPRAVKSSRKTVAVL